MDPEYCRQRAEECVRWARRTRESSERIKLLETAYGWLSLADDDVTLVPSDHLNEKAANLENGAGRPYII
jgi:hypothetical protein